MSWPEQGSMANQAMPHGHPMHRAASFADFGQQMNPYSLDHQMPQRHSVSAEAHEYHGQGHALQMVQRTASMPQQAFYVMDHNAGIATMSSNVAPGYHIPRQHVERPTLDIPYSTGGMPSLSSSPASFSPASGHSPALQDGLYTHQTPASGTYGLQDAPAVEQHGSLVPYTQHMQQPHGSQPEHEWGYHYQPSVEVTTIGQIPAFGSGVYDLYSGPKIEYDDPSMQLPSSRVETM
ncbi:hypothetical protein UVI_02023780 [Ustilaginoidea virens]|nr:hypothetical protein UVI_02023780 [Ustilaginoidea virens]